MNLEENSRGIVSRQWQKIKNARSIGPLLATNSALSTYGWFKSYQSKRSVGTGGNPIPWITYPCIRFLEKRLKAHFLVFEWGSGGSTLWWSQVARKVISVEHDEEWGKRVSSELPANCQLIKYPKDAPEYVECVKEIKDVDIIIIDGRNRVSCAKACPESLSSKGIIIWDNTDRSEYEAGIKYLKESGFRNVDFIGMSPIVGIECTTSIFYKDGNMLDI